MMDGENILLLGGSSHDASELSQVSPQHHIQRADSRHEAFELLKTGMPFTCVVVTIDERSPSVSECASVLIETNRSLPIVALANPSQVDRLKPLIDEGLDGWILRPHYTSLELVLARVRHQRSVSSAGIQQNEALARLAGHIAHDVNNILAVIMAHAARISAIPGKAAEVAQSILQATVRGRELTHQVLSFGRLAPPLRCAIDVRATVFETLRLLEPTLSHVQLKTLLPPEPVEILADVGQVHQVISNLCTNAGHAMPEGGTLTVECRKITVGSDHPQLRHGDYGVISIGDTGVGMTEELRRRIFEPFFSTRERDQGTGLGLAIVQNIVANHEGHIEVESATGQGSIFRIYWPARA